MLSVRSACRGGGIEFFPDACANFLFKCSPDDPRLVVSGVSTEKLRIEVDEGALYFGFKPYSTSGMRPLPFDWEEVAGGEAVELAGVEIFGPDLVETLLFCEGFQERCAAMLAFAADRLSDDDYTPDFVERSEAYICEASGNLRTSEVGDCVGYSDRWCRKRFKEAVGVSLKSYSSIMRFQGALRELMRNDCPPMVNVAIDNGYFDQPHLTREFKRYTGETPTNLRKRYAVPA